MLNYIKNAFVRALIITYGPVYYGPDTREGKDAQELITTKDIFNMTLEDILQFNREVNMVNAQLKYLWSDYVIANDLLKAIGGRLKELYQALDNEQQLEVWKVSFRFCKDWAGIKKPNIDVKKYSGFTCPDCSSHMFGTTVNRSFMKDGIEHRLFMAFPANAHVGTCNENRYSANGCGWQFNRDIPEDEDRCIYWMSLEEHMAQYKSPAA